MHELVLDSLRVAPRPHVLARCPCDDGALLALFGGGEAPRWLARTAVGAFACARLRAEAEALTHLEPWAEILAIPHLLGWADAPEAAVQPEACLVQSGLPGEAIACQRARIRLDRPFPSWLGVALAWLERFQRAVIVPARYRIHRASHDLGGPAELDAEVQAWSRELTTLAGDEPAHTRVASHGDFWLGNLLFQRHRPAWIGVVDWCGFGARSPLYDVYTLLARIPWRVGGRGKRGSFALCLLRSGPPRDCLRAWAARAGLDPAAAGRHFYRCLLERMLWELGHGMQTRSVIEREQARVEWRAGLDGLCQLGWPDPFADR